MGHCLYGILHLPSRLLEVDAVVGEGCCAEWTFPFLPFPAWIWNRSCLPEKPITEKRLTLGGVGMNQPIMCHHSLPQLFIGLPIPLGSILNYLLDCWRGVRYLVSLLTGDVVGF